MPDPIFSDPRLAAIYDSFDDDRSDLDAYLAMVDEFAQPAEPDQHGEMVVVDIGCGTGSFCSRLATTRAMGRVRILGVDPAVASLDIARTKPGADAVQWIHGDATSLPSVDAHLAFMTGNVAQVFVTEDEWTSTLRGVRDALRVSGRLIFESRVPEREAWLGWNREETFTEREVPGVGHVSGWCDVLAVGDQLVTFRWTYEFQRDGTTLTSESTLRFRSLDELTESVMAAGFVVDEVRGAPDRPGLEFVVIARAR